MGREGYKNGDPSRFQAYQYPNVEEREEIYDTPIAKRGNKGIISRKNIQILDSDEEENIETPLTNGVKKMASSSGWLEKTSHHTLTSKSSKKTSSHTMNQVKKKTKIIHDSDESEGEIWTGKADSPEEDIFKDIAPTVIYQLQEDNISKLMKDRENGIHPLRSKRVADIASEKSQGCSLSHSITQPKKGTGRLLKKRMRSLSLTDSDVESIDNIKTAQSNSDDEVAKLVPKGYDLIVLESDDEIQSVSSSRKSGQSLKQKPIIVEESESELNSSVDEESVQSEGSYDEDDNRNAESSDGDGEKWYGSDSDGESDHEKHRSRKRGSDDEKTEEEERMEMERKCRRVLQRCADVSKLLRQALISWSSGGKDSTQSNGIGNCVNLISMGEQHSNIISQDLITNNISPHLLMKDYQLVGLNWLKLMHTNDVNGVLADDMGLGKTVQTIGFVGWLHYDRQSRNKKPHTHLIVVPASTLSNWTKEFSRFCPHLKVVRFHGTVDEKYRVKQKLKRTLLERSGAKDRIDVVLTTYTQFERESGADDRKFLRKIPFEYLVLDEAHCIKNSQSSRYSNLRNLNTRRRLLLSGTPVQNDVRELLSLLGFLMPQVFKSEYTEMLLASLKLEHLPDTDTKPKQRNKKKSKDETPIPSSSTLLENNTNESIASLENLRTMLGPFVLRRLKRDVLHQLVEKEEEVLRMQMSESQRALYGDIIQRHMLRRAQVTTKSSDVMDLTADPEYVVRNISSSEANNIFTALRKAANHPLLLRVHFSNDSVIDLIASICQTTGHFGDQCDIKRIKNEIKEMSDFDINSICLEYPGVLGHLQLPSSVLYESPKMKKLETLLPKLIAEGHRILIFSQWTKMLDIIGALMEDMGLRFLRLDGSTPVRERQNLIDQFEKNKLIPIFILSTKAGGLGINLTAADTVIIYDLDFNPENDRQAEDRCHRIGQTKTVTVYKMVTEETVEEIIYETGQRKQRLTKAVLSDHSYQENPRNGEGKDGEGAMNGSEINKMLQAALQNYMKK